VLAGYIRVSTSRQGDGESPDNQRERLRAAGATEFYVDVVSGYRLPQRRKAGEFQRLTADIRAGKLTRLLTTRLDRIARRDAIVLELAELCEAHGVEFLRLGSGRVDTTTTSPVAVAILILHLLLLLLPPPPLHVCRTRARRHLVTTLRGCKNQ
jgi:site-specific DNA recombinase